LNMKDAAALKKTAADMKKARQRKDETEPL
jgi:hypothetical protein